MTPRSATERGPGTVTATREQMIETWLRLYGGTDTDVASDVGGLFDALAGATAAVPLDVERLAEAMVTAFRAEAKDNWPFLRGSGWPAYHEHGNPPQTLVVSLIAERLAAEYARLGADEEGGT